MHGSSPKMNITGNMFMSLTDDNVVAHEHQVSGNIPPGPGHRKRIRGTNSAGRKCWRPAWPLSWSQQPRFSWSES